jgi:hypothetical protein
MTMVSSPWRGRPAATCPMLLQPSGTGGAGVVAVFLRDTVCYRRRILGVDVKSLRAIRLPEALGTCIHTLMLGEVGCLDGVWRDAVTE